MLQEKLHNPNIIAVHRLDKETSGCILFAMTLNAKNSYSNVPRKQNY